MANPFYTNNFRGRAGRRERAKHLVDEFKAIEDAFTKLQAYNIATYLTTYVNTTNLSGEVTIKPDNGFLQEITLTEDTLIKMNPPLNESQYRVSLLIHGAGFKVTNGWGAQTWKEYGQDNWWELWCGDGPYASMLLDFFWDICSHTWICVASSKNIVNTAGGAAVERFYPLLCDLTNVEGDDTLGFTRADNGQTMDQHQQYHYLSVNEPRFHGVRWVENWCPTASDLTTVAWQATDCTVTTDAGAGPASEDVQRLSFVATGGKLGCFILPSFGRASTKADPIKVAVSFKGRAVSTDTSLRLSCAFCGKRNQTPPVHDSRTMTLDTTWQTYGAVLDILKDGNDTKSLALDQYTPKTLMEIAFVSPSGSTGDDVQITDVQIEVLRDEDEELVSEIQDTTIGSSIPLSGSGTGTWDDGSKTLTLASVGQSVDLSATLEAGKTYLVHPRLQAGDAADIRMQNAVTVWAAGDVADSLYVQDAPFTFQYDGGELTFVLLEGVSSVYLIDVYEVSNDRAPYCYQNPYTIGDGGLVSTAATLVPYDSGILLGVAREVGTTNEIPYNYFRTFSAWDQVGLSGISVNDCRNPVFQSEYGIDGWPSRATILQGASRVTDGYIQRDFTLTPSTNTKDFQMWIRRSLDVEGNQVYFPQHNDVTTPLSRYVDFEAELRGGPSTIASGRLRLDIQNASFVGATSDVGYELGVYVTDDWYLVNIALTNDGTHDTFRIRVYPASGDTPDPSVTDVEQQGWVVIDWAQFEDSGGVFVSSSPVIGGETRSTEEFTTGLPDGYFYRSDTMEHVADAVAGNIIWDVEDQDGVWKNLIYSTTEMIADPNVRNMHEFGLVDQQVVPNPNLVIATTTPYPVEVEDAVEFGGMQLIGGYLLETPNDEMDFTTSFLGGSLTYIRIETGPYNDEIDFNTTFLGGSMVRIRYEIGPYNDEMDFNTTFLSATLVSKLVTADTPDEAVEFSVSLIDGFLTDV